MSGTAHTTGTRVTADTIAMIAATLTTAPAVTTLVTARAATTRIIDRADTIDTSAATTESMDISRIERGAGTITGHDVPPLNSQLA